MDLTLLNDAVKNHAAFRRRQRLQPIGGPGDKVFPPTFPGQNDNDPPRHAFEQRRVAEQDGSFRPDPVECVLLDSVQSQANRLEEALLHAVREDGLELPHVTVRFDETEASAIGEITSLEAPHRVYDAIFRDSRAGDVPFMQSEIGEAIKRALPRDAVALLEASPNALLFGAWHSQGEGGGLGSKFPRCIASEIIGIDVTRGIRTSSRMDPLGARASALVHKDENANWDIEKENLGKKSKAVKPSEIGHGNITPSISNLGVTMEHAEQITVVTLAGLRRLRFGSDSRNTAARAYLAALGILAIRSNESAGYSLRSRCDLIPDGHAPLELIHSDGTTTEIHLTVDDARALYDSALSAGRAAGFSLAAKPTVLQPQDKLVKLITLSRNQALAGRSIEED